jgi:hypothetical protein
LYGWFCGGFWLVAHFELMGDRPVDEIDFGTSIDWVNFELTGVNLLMNQLRYIHRLSEF